MMWVRISRRVVVLAVAFGVGALSGCDATVEEGGCPLAGSGECYRYQAFDERGEPAASGFIRLDVEDVEAGRVTGTWQIMAAPGNGAHASGLGAAVGRRDGESFTLTLIPEGTLDEVELSGVMGNREIEGVWIDLDTAVQGSFQGSVVLQGP